MERNEYDELYAMRQRHFRNLQRMDKNFMTRKEKVLWPLFDINRNQMTLEQLKDKKKKNAQPKSQSQNLRTGKNPKMFKLDSI